MSKASGVFRYEPCMVVSKAACVKRPYFRPLASGNRRHWHRQCRRILMFGLGSQRLDTLTSQVCVDRKFIVEADLAKSVAFGALVVQGSGVDVDSHV